MLELKYILVKIGNIYRSRYTGRRTLAGQLIVVQTESSAVHYCIIKTVSENTHFKRFTVTCFHANPSLGNNFIGK